MTINQILVEVSPHRPMSVPTLYRHLHTLRIKPVGARQIPQRYPDDAGARILKHLGVSLTLTKPAKRGGAR